jgi:hypothetical protein
MDSTHEIETVAEDSPGTTPGVALEDIATENELPDYEPSICIPRVDNTTTQKQVMDIFERVFGDGTNGVVQAVDVVTRQNEMGDSFKRVFVHFKDWTSMPKECWVTARQTLLSGKQIKIMYEPGYYWKCSASRLQRPEWLSKV